MHARLASAPSASASASLRLRHALGRVAAAALLLFVGRTAAAQELAGVLRSAVSRNPSVGVLITVSRSADDSLVARTVTGARGTWRLRATTGPLVVRAFRVGHEPVELARVTLADGEVRRVDVALPDLPVTLVALNQRVDNRCTANPGQRTLVAQLFGAARTALLSSQVPAEDTTVRAVLRRTTVRLDARERPAGRPDTVWLTRASLAPFSSVSIDTLMREGFRVFTPDGGMTYRAPGADVLTDDRFLAHYCLQIAATPSPDSTWVGVSFQPTDRSRGRVRVTGTLWLDRTTQALRRIEFGYVGLEPALNRATPGGVIEYAQTVDGTWFVPDWVLRLPRVVRFTRGSLYGGEIDDAFVDGVLVMRGSVLDISDREGPVFTTGELALASSDSTLTARLLAYRDSVRCAGPATPFTLHLTGQVTAADDAPVARTLVRASWVIQRLVDFKGLVSYEDREMFTHTDDAGRFLLCGVPREHLVQVRVGPSDAPRARTTLRIRDLQPTAHVELRARPQ